MSTGYSWEGIRQTRATLLGARHVAYLSASVVAVSTWGAMSSAQSLPLFTYIHLIYINQAARGCSERYGVINLYSVCVYMEQSSTVGN